MCRLSETLPIIQEEGLQTADTKAAGTLTLDDQPPSEHQRLRPQAVVQPELRHPERFNRKCHWVEWVCDKACS